MKGPLLKPVINQTLEASRHAVVPYDNELLHQLRIRAKVIARRAGLVEVEAEDVAQNALLALIQNWEVLSPCAWITTVALRGAQEVIRQRMRNARFAGRIQTECELMSNRDKPWDLLPDIAQTLTNLGQLEKDIFLSQELSLCTWPELSIQTGLSISTLKRRLERTRRLIRRRQKLVTYKKEAHADTFNQGTRTLE